MKLLWSIFPFSLLLLNAACGPKFMAIDSKEFYQRLGSNSCFENTKVNACVFYKNPLGAFGFEVLTGGITIDTNLTSSQDYGVNITDLDGSGYLQNASIQVNTEKGERAQAVDGSWKFKFAGDANAKAVQVHTYYWANQALNLMTQRNAPMYIKNRAVQITVNATSTSWLATQNRISLEFDTDGNQTALDAGLMLHLLAQANLYHGTNGGNEDFAGDVDHQACAISGGPTYDKGCCKTKFGCGRALAAGQADYFIATIFPDQPTLGESWVNRATGFNACDTTRDLRSHKNATADQLFTACSAKGAAGQVYNMGSLYASIWYEIRNGLSDTEKNDFDRLYMQHLAALRGKDTFVTALQKIKTIDQATFASRFSNKFDAEYSRRGLL